MASEPPIGAHLISRRKGYTHHGICVGGGNVIHYSGLANGLNSGPVEEVNLKEFSGGNGFTVRTYTNGFSETKIVERARSRVGESSYSVFNNNCEHFCLWCVVGDHVSPQVDKTTWVSAPSIGAIVGLVARGAVAASGPVIGLSGPGIMGSLAAVGSVVGGGAVAGFAILGGAPGAAMASVVNKVVLADNPSLQESEKKSRAAGRVASYCGAGAGTVGSIAAVGIAGTTAGLSAAGITSGLAAIGGVVGGGMAAGLAIGTAAPVVAATVAGYGVYKLVRWAKK